MGANWAPKYTPEQREAMRTAKLDRALTAREVAERAANGTLQEGLGPFDANPKTVYALAREERERRYRQEHGTILEKAPEKHLISRLEGALNVQVRNLERRARKSSKLTTTQQISLSKWQRELIAATKELRALQAKEPKPEPEPPNPEIEKPTESIIETLARTSTPSPPNSSSGDAAPRARKDENTKRENNDGAVSSCAAR